MEIIISLTLFVILLVFFISADSEHEHNWEYDGDGFSHDDKHYGKYYKCNLCGKEKFISNTEFMNMKDKDMDFWANRPWTYSAKIKKTNKKNKYIL